MEKDFGRRIAFDPDRPGVIWINGKKFENPAKRVKIPAAFLNNLESLAIEAFFGESDYSSDQQFLNESLEKLKKKFPNEEPQEVWRRNIARLATWGINAEDIATALVIRNERLNTALNLNSLPKEGYEKALKTVESKILDNWPSARNVA